MPQLGGWIKAKLSHLIKDFNPANIELNVRAGSLALKAVTLASDALQILSGQLCCAVPLVAKNLFVGQAHVQFQWGSFSTKIILHDVRLQLETQSATDWDIAGASKNFEATKMEALRMHSRMMRLGYKEGAGYFHSLAAAFLAEFEFCVNGLQCQIADSVSLFIDGHSRPFVLGTGVDKVELAAGVSTIPANDGVLRPLLLERPCVFLDFGSAREENTSATENSVKLHDWILKPSEEMSFELGLLQCRRPIYADILTGDAQQGFNLIRLLDFAELSLPIGTDLPNGKLPGSAKSSLSAETLGQVLLPASAVLTAVQPLHLDLSPKKLVALLAFVAFAGLGYGTVLQGVSAKHEQHASPEELAKYGQDWLKAVLYRQPDNNVTGEALDEFERTHALEVLVRAREHILEATLSADEFAAKSNNNLQEKPSHAQAVVLSLKNVIFGRSCVSLPLPDQVLEANSTEESWQETAQLIRETLMNRDPGWKQSWKELRQADGPALVFGARCQKIQVDINLDHKYDGFSKFCSMNVEEIVFSATRHHNGTDNAQAALFEFHMEDHYGPQKLARLAHDAPMRVPVANRIVTPRVPPRSEDVVRSKDVDSSSRSELNFLIGRRKGSSGDDSTEPDIWLRLRSVGVMHICLPVHQLLVLGEGMFPAELRRSIRKTLSGDPWRCKVKEAIIALADVGWQEHFDEFLDVADAVLNEKFELHVNLEPVHILIPVPGSERDKVKGSASTSSGPTATDVSPIQFWGEAIDFSLGSLSACSRLGVKFVRNSQDSEQLEFLEDAAEEQSPSSRKGYYSELATDIRGISMHRRAWAEDVYSYIHDDEGRVIMPTTDSKFAIFFSPRRPNGWRKVVMDYWMSSADMNFRESDIEAFVEMVDELLWTFSATLLDAAKLAQLACQRTLLELALSDSDTPSADRMPGRRRNKHVHPVLEPVPQRLKLWQFITRIDRMRIQFQTESGLLRSGTPEMPCDLVFALDKVELSTTLSRDGSLRLEQMVRRADVTGFARGRVAKIYGGGHRRPEERRGKHRLRGSDGVTGEGLSERDNSRDTTGRITSKAASLFVADNSDNYHFHFAVECKAPREVGGEWYFVNWCFIHKPIFMTWWQALSHPLKACCVSVQRALLWRHTKKLKFTASTTKTLLKGLTAVLPECIDFHLSINNGEVLVPCGGEGMEDDAPEPVTPKRSSSYNLSPLDKPGVFERPDKPSLLGNPSIFIPQDRPLSTAVAASVEGVPVLSTQATVNAHIYNFRLPRNEMMQITALPEFDLRASLIGFTANFILPPENKSQEPCWSWAVLGRSTAPSLALLQRCRINLEWCSGKSLPTASAFEPQKRGDMKVRLAHEPVTLHVYPATRFMLADLANSGAVKMAVQQIQQVVSDAAAQAESSTRMSAPASPGGAQDEGKQPVFPCESPPSEHEVPFQQDTIPNVPRAFVQRQGLTPPLSEVSSPMTPPLTQASSPTRVLGSSSADLNLQSPVAARTTSRISTSSSSTIFETLPSVTLDLVITMEALVVQLSEPPGAAQQLHADMKIEDLQLHVAVNVAFANTDSDRSSPSNAMDGAAKASAKGGCSPRLAFNTAFQGPDLSWQAAFKAMFQMNVLDVLSLQTVPILEPAFIDFTLQSKLSEGTGVHLFPLGQAIMTWVNLNLPLGLFFAARCWLQSDEMQRRKRRLENAQEDDAPNNNVTTASHSEKFSNGSSAFGDSRFITGTTPLSPAGSQSIQCEIINKLGQAVGVKQLYGASNSPFTYVAPGQYLPRGQAQDACVGVPTVPPLAIRSYFWGQVVEINFQSELQVPQFEVVRITRKHAEGSDAAAVSLIFRAVPDTRGTGCALLISSSVMVRNTSSLHVVWAMPEPEEMEDKTALLIDSEHRVESFSSSQSAAPRIQRGHASVRRLSATSSMTSKETNLRRGTSVTFARENSFEGGDFSQRLSTDSSGRDEKPNQELAPGNHFLLPLPWLTAASDPVQAQCLTMSVAGSSEWIQILPEETLVNLGCFDYNKAHRTEEQRVHLGGSLLQFTNAVGEPVHLCCTVTVGLVSERAVCLEIIVSSIFLVINHLPLPIKISASNKRGLIRPEKNIESGGSSKEYLAADFLQIHLDTPGGATTALATKLKCGRPFRSALEQHCKSKPANMARFARGASMESFSDEVQYDLLDNVIDIRVLTSSAFDLDPPMFQGDNMDGWLQTLNWLHPPEWLTFRRAITLCTACVIENFSTCDLWFRPAGARKLKTQRKALEVPKGSWRVMPNHLTAVGKIRVSTTAHRNRKDADTFRWESRGLLVKHLSCRLREEDENKKMNVFFGVQIDRAPIPFGKTRLIQVYDSVTAWNRTDAHIQCEIPISSLPFKFLSRSKYLMRTTTRQTQVVHLDPGRQDRFDSDVTVFAFCTMPVTGHTLSQPAKTKKKHYTKGAMRRGSAEKIVVARNSANSTPLGDASMVHTDSMEATPDMQDFMSDGLGMVRSLGDHVNTLGSNLKHALGHLSSYTSFVDFTRPVSFQIRTHYSVVDGTAVFENFRVSISKSHHGSRTVICFDLAEPRFLVHNLSEFHVEIWQQNVQGVKEILKPDQQIRFVWYDPNSVPNLMARTVSCEDIPGPTRESSFFSKVRSVGVESEHSNSTKMSQSGKNLKMIREFDATSGLEILKIMTAEGYDAWLRSRERKHRRKTPVDAGTGRTTGASSSDQLGSCRSDHYAMRPGVKFILEGVGVSLIDASPTHILYATCDLLTVCVAPSALESKKLSMGASTNLGRRQRLRRILAVLPAIDASVSLHNFQIDSHIPGSFFPCAVRPLNVHSQLWRSLSVYSANPAQAKMKEPVMSFNVTGCQLLARNSGTVVVMVYSFVGQLAQFVVNIDEAVVVGVAAYYCRIAIYFKLPPFNKIGRRQSAQAEEVADYTLNTPMSVQGHSQASGIGKASNVAAPAAPMFLMSVERKIEIKETTSYLSLRLMESASPYVEVLQRDEHVGVLLGMLTPFYGAALFQPAMVSTHARPLLLHRPYMSFAEFGKLIDNHFVVPMKTRIGLLLFFSMDAIGNPRQLLLGTLAGLRELVRQPWKRGLVGIPSGILICVCSILGSWFHCLSRIINAAVKQIDRVQSKFHRTFNIKGAKRGADIFALSRMPMSWWDGIYRGGVLALLQSRRIFLNLRQLLKWYRMTLKTTPLRSLCYAVLLVLAWVVTLGLGILEVVLLFLYNVLQGLVSSFYRRSAEAVCDMAPLQLLALELPTQVRPVQQQFHSGEQDGSRSAVAPTFSYLPSLVREQLEPEAGLVLPWNWHRVEDDEAVELDETIVWAIWCGKACAGDGEVQIVAATRQQVSLLEIRDWGNITNTGRPKRPKPTYRWLWQMPLSDISFISISNTASPQRFTALKDSRDSTLMIYHGATPKTVYFASNQQALLAFEILSRSIGGTDSPGD